MHQYCLPTELSLNVQLKLNGTKRCCQSDFSASVTVAGELATQNHTGTIFCFVLFFVFSLFCFVLCVFANEMRTNSLNKVSLRLTNIELKS